ncbi:MAG: hypothetical protein ACM3PP_00590 [Candidatus Saccharibacteria bacterium]
MTINDRFTRGWVAGTCGGLIGAILSFLSHYMSITALRLSDWSAILIYGRVPPFSMAEQLYAIIVLAGTTGIIGIIFAYMLPLITEENVYFKGWIFFLMPWWLIYLLTALFKTPGTLNLSLLTAVSNGVVISITGLTAVYSYLLLDPNRQPIHSYGLAQPAVKRMGSQDYESDEN